ncbi:unnamed protein product [Schistocephalus solidus]|uniref:Uncharacterized protein n=1 Tax=Schistocephalus solidus TaxID=70667 RepID=A0A183THM8_SCHSO|nr:unnamed protein product [Schistocephalus solidus]
MMAITSDMLLQGLQRWLEYVDSPLVRVYGAKVWEPKGQVQSTCGGSSAVAAQGDARHDGSSQHPPFAYPFADLGFQSGLRPPSPPTEHIVGACQVARAEETPLRSCCECPFEHSMTIPTPVRTVSLLRMAAGLTFDVPVARHRAAAAVAASPEGETFIIGSYTAEASTRLDIAMLPSLSSEDPDRCAPTEVDMTLCTPGSPKRTIIAPLEEMGEWEQEGWRPYDDFDFSDVVMTPGVRKRHAKRVMQAANVRQEVSEVEVCLSYAQCEVCPRIHTRENRASAEDASVLAACLAPNMLLHSPGNRMRGRNGTPELAAWQT